MIDIKMLNQNRTFTNPSYITPEWVIVHSVGSAGYPTRDRLYNHWNKKSAKKSCHGMVDDKGGIQTLPFNFRGWHAGSQGNGKSIGFETSEPSNIAYIDKEHTTIDTKKYRPDNPDNMADFFLRYYNAVEMAAYMCKAINVSADKILSHHEAALRGMATNHADVDHWFPLFGKTMDMFRTDVDKRLSGHVLLPDDLIPAPKPEPESGDMPYKVKVTADVLNVRTSPMVGAVIVTQIRKGEVYTITEEREGWGKLKSGAGWISLDYVKRI